MSKGTILLNTFFIIKLIIIFKIYRMIEESNGNSLLTGKTQNTDIVASPSIDDLSQSLSISEYTDADESMSAPTEFLAEVNYQMFQIYRERDKQNMKVQLK